MQKLGLNKDKQKKVNRGLILKLIATQQCTSRIDLSRSTGLTKTAISQIVGSLIAQDYLIETEKEYGEGVGRNPMGLNISPNAPCFAGLLIDRGRCEAVICDIQLNIIKHVKIVREWASKDELISCVYRMMDQILSGETRVSGIGVSSIGPVSVREGKIIHPLYFNDIRDIEIRRLMEERYHLPVAFDHDNQSAALAEQLYGNGRGYEDILLVSISRGVGCGITVGGSRIHSYTGYAPEIGHISIDRNGLRCPCGNVGCLEMYVNSPVILERFRRSTGLNLSYADFCSRDSEEVRVIMDEMIDNLAAGLVTTLNITNSQIILLGGDCGYWKDSYIRRLEEEINRRKFGNREMWIPVKKNFFGEHTAVLGAASNVINRMFHGELIEGNQETVS